MPLNQNSFSKFGSLVLAYGILAIGITYIITTKPVKVPLMDSLAVPQFQTINKVKTFLTDSTKRHDTKKKFTFLLGGVMKCGTTSLYYMLRRHPHLYLSSRKEIRFFMREDINWTDPDYSSYESHISDDNRSNVIGEATPGYIFWPNVLERIKHYNPDMKLIFIFCNPIKRTLSQWQMATRHKNEDRGFEWCIHDGHAQFASQSTPTITTSKYDYVARGFYGFQLARLFSIFPREQILLLTTEDLSRNSSGVVTEISRFLNVLPPEKEISSLWKNKAKYNKTMHPDDVGYLRNVYAEDFKLFLKLSGLNVTHWFQ